VGHNSEPSVTRHQLKVYMGSGDHGCSDPTKPMEPAAPQQDRHSIDLIGINEWCDR
jgi:hypothetical protein